MGNYIIAVKRGHRDRAPKDLAQSISQIEGVGVVATPSPQQVRVQATDEGIERVRQVLGACCHVEPVIAHSYGPPPPGEV